MSLKQKTIKGLFWSAVSQGGKLASQFVITSILARILSPTDFGMVAMATIFTGFAMIFGELGISSALVQKQDVTEEHWSSAFWLNLFFGIMLTIIFIYTAPYISLFYKRPELTALLQVLSLNFIFSSFTIIQQTILTREMNFRSLMIRDLAAVIIAGIVGIMMACRGYGVWSLVVQSLVFSAMNGLLLWTMSPWRPKFRYSGQAIKDIFHFSKHMTGFQIVNYFARNVDSLLIGRYLGPHILGYYSLAYKLMMLPVQNFTWVISKVMFPAFSKIQGDPDKVRRNFLKMIKIVTLITFPVMSYLFVTAPELIHLVFGDRWNEAIPLVRILCFCGMVQSIGSLGGTIYLSQGKAGIQFKMSLISTFLLSLTLFFAVHFGIRAVTMAYTIFYLIWTHFSIAIVASLISLKLSKIYRTIVTPLVVSMIFLITAISLDRFIIFQPLFKVIFEGILGFIICAALIFTTKQVCVTTNRQLALGEI
jgi:O-antigen/teichoic acid export membrane protein